MIPEELTLKIPSLPDNIRIVESFIDQIREKYNLSDDVYGNVIVAVTESVNNAIIHGNQNNKEKNVHLGIAIDNNNISFSIEDEGSGFNYNNLPDPTSPENIDQPGGSGIFLIKHLADEVHFISSGNKVNLKFYLS